MVDELAHSNAPGCRHEKRWQDVEELLRAGIHVWTTLNVQHLESLNDVVGQITGVVVRETIPDRVFEAADELELIDITPEELLGRLSAGKIYLGEQARRAIDKFFQRGNLVALRELSMRQAARLVHSDVESARSRQSAKEPWATNERLLVCVGPSPTTARVIRTAKRMAAALDAPWMAVAVEATHKPPSDDARERIARHFQLAERLGAETAVTSGRTVAEAILEFARARNVTKIFIGKTTQPRWRRFLLGSVVDEIVDGSGAIDVYVIHGEEEGELQRVTGDRVRRAGIAWGAYVRAVLSVILAACFDGALRGIGFADSEANAAMLFLVAVAWVAFRQGRGPAVLASVLSVFVFDYFFVPPYLTLAISDAQYAVTFVVMLAIGFVISELTSRLRVQLDNSRRREQHTSTLYELGRQLSSMYGRTFLATAAGTKLGDLLQTEVAVYLRRDADSPELIYSRERTIAEHHLSLPVASWVIEHEQLAGMGTNTLPDAVALFIPVTGTQGTHGAIAIRGEGGERLLRPDIRRLLEACANQLALALERDQLTLDAANARVEAETEQVRSSLLTSVSHDLRTPLAAIAGASGSLTESETLPPETRRELLDTIRDESERLHRMLENILQMSRLEAGASPPNRQWHVLEELVGSALHRTARELAGRTVETHLPLELPLLFLDGLLMEQVFVNLLENAARHTPGDSRIVISAECETKGDVQWIRIVVSDDGPGLPAGAEGRVFEKFFRAAPTADSGRGSGLGLAICRAIVAAHGGTIMAVNRPTGGAEFVVRLPVAKDAPRVVVE